MHPQTNKFPQSSLLKEENERKRGEEIKKKGRKRKREGDGFRGEEGRGWV